MAPVEGISGSDAGERRGKRGNEGDAVKGDKGREKVEPREGDASWWKGERKCG